MEAPRDLKGRIVHEAMRVIYTELKARGGWAWNDSVSTLVGEVVAECVARKLSGAAYGERPLIVRIVRSEILEGLREAIRADLEALGAFEPECFELSFGDEEAGGLRPCVVDIGRGKRL